jgi:hypothetical protein
MKGRCPGSIKKKKKKKKIELGRTRNVTLFVRELSIHPRMTETKDSQQT